MSHFSTYKTEIKGLTVPMLISMVQSFAKQQGLTTVNSLIDYYGNKQKVDIAMKGPGLKNGIGFSIEDGKLVVKGDAWMQQDFNRVKELFPAYARAMIVARNAPVIFGAKLRGIRTEIKQNQVVQIMEVC